MRPRPSDHVWTFPALMASSKLHQTLAVLEKPCGGDIANRGRKLPPVFGERLGSIALLQKVRARTAARRTSGGCCEETSSTRSCTSRGRVIGPALHGEAALLEISLVITCNHRLCPTNGATPANRSGRSARPTRAPRARRSGSAFASNVDKRTLGRTQMKRCFSSSLDSVAEAFESGDVPPGLLFSGGD